jgi:hypothetical protein
MMWLKPYVAPPNLGDTKIVRKFLLWPRTQVLPNKDEVTRWLETADLVYEYTYDSEGAHYWDFKGFATDHLINKIEGQS